MSSSFNATLWHLIGDAISTEARAAYNQGGLNGLTFFAPQVQSLHRGACTEACVSQINMASNPLWGRNMECPGEDPHLSSVFAYEYITGFQVWANKLGAEHALSV